MRKIHILIGASAVLVLGAIVPAQAQAFDASCQPVNAATVAMANSNRYRVTGTITDKGKAHPTEEIYVGDTLYIRYASQWSKTAVTPRDRIDAGKGLGLTMYGCRTIGNEYVNGEAAIIYEEHSDLKQPKIHSDGKIWISTKSGLPLRSEGDAGSGSSKLHSSKKYTYGASVRAPADARDSNSP